MSILSKLTGRSELPANETAPEANRQPDLERMLLDLTRYGHPRLHSLKGGWFACIEMNTTAEGTSFDVKSEFGNATPTAAVTQATERMRAALSAIGVRQ